MFLGATVKLSKFCSLRPAHVKLCNKDFDVTSILQIDFAENVPLDSQEDEPDESIQGNQSQVRIIITRLEQIILIINLKNFFSDISMIVKDDSELKDISRTNSGRLIKRNVEFELFIFIFVVYQLIK